MSDYNQQYSLIKENIQKLIHQGKFEASKVVLKEYEKINAGDIDIYCLRASLLLGENKLNEAIVALEAGVKKYPVNFDLLYNLGMLKEQSGELKLAYENYLKAKYVVRPEQEQLITEALSRLTKQEPSLSIQAKRKLAIFVKQGLDSFLNDIIEGLQSDFEIKKMIITRIDQIDQGMAWADICWFEWCDELIAYGSKLELAKHRKILCRLHRYEAFSDYINNVTWRNVDKIIFVAEHIRDAVTKKINLPIEKLEVVYNGINTNKFKFVNKNRGYNLAWVGYLNLRKNPMLVIQYFYELAKEDKRYQLYIAGSFQDEIVLHYIQEIIEKLGLQSNVHFDGFIPNEQMSNWLSDKHYIVSGSIAEGHPVGIMEAMCSGIKPVIHYFPGIEKFYPKKYIYYCLNDFKHAILENEYKSKEYRSFIEQNYSLNKQLNKVKKVVNSLEIIQSGRDIIQINQGDLKISYVIPIFNGEKFINKALDSILNQEIPPYEVIALDDCSSDCSYKILLNYNKNVIIKRNTRNLGEIATTNQLLKMAKGDFVKVLHQDDFLAVNYSKEISRIKNLRRYSFIVNDFEYIKEEDENIQNYLKKIWDGMKINPNDLTKNQLQKILVIAGNMLGSPSNVLYVREYLSRIDYLNQFEGVRHYYGADYFTYLKLMELSKPYITFNQLSYRYEHSCNTTSKFINSILRIKGSHETLKKFEYILNKEEKRTAYNNLLGKANYSIINCKNIEEKKKMIEYVEKNIRMKI